MVTTQLLRYVQHSKILPFDYVYESDHCSMYIDKDLRRYIKVVKKLDQKLPRGLSSKHPKVVKHYKKIVYDHMNEPTIHTKIKELHTKFTTGSITHEDSELVNYIVKDLLQHD